MLFALLLRLVLLSVLTFALPSPTSFNLTARQVTSTQIVDLPFGPIPGTLVRSPEFQVRRSRHYIFNLYVDRPSLIDGLGMFGSEPSTEQTFEARFRFRGDADLEIYPQVYHGREGESISVNFHPIFNGKILWMVPLSLRGGTGHMSVYEVDSSIFRHDNTRGG